MHFSFENLRSLFTLLALLASLFVVSAQPIRWVTYGEALNLAAKEWKPVYIYFFSESCPYCGAMEDTFSN